MKRKIAVGILLLGSLSLAACGAKKEEKKTENKGKVAQVSTGVQNQIKTGNVVTELPAEEVFKNWQYNLATAYKDTVFGIDKPQYNGNLKLALTSPMGGGNLVTNYLGYSDGKAYKASLGIDGDFKVSDGQQVMTGDFSVMMDLMGNDTTTYLNLKKFILKGSDPRYSQFTELAKNIENKWFFQVRPKNEINKNLDRLKSQDLASELKKYPLFKVDKKLGQYEYKVHLDKDNLAKYIYNIGKKVNPNLTGNIEEIKKELGSGDISGIFKIEDNLKYFTFSGALIEKTPAISLASTGDNLQTTPFKIQFTEKKLYLNIASGDMILDLNRNGDDFQGLLTLKNSSSPDGKININISGKLNKTDLGLNLGTSLNGLNLKLESNTKFKEKEGEEKIVFPQDALPLEQVQVLLQGG